MGAVAFFSVVPMRLVPMAKAGSVAPSSARASPAPKAAPPVCRMVREERVAFDLLRGVKNQQRIKQRKRQGGGKQKSNKTFQFKSNIAEHDLRIRANRIVKLLGKGQTWTVDGTTQDPV